MTKMITYLLVLSLSVAAAATITANLITLHYIVILSKHTEFSSSEKNNVFLKKKLTPASGIVLILIFYECP